MNGVKTVGSELLGPTNPFNSIAFPSLEVLEFKDMEGWENWLTEGDDNNQNTTFFPRLREIYLVNCMKLRVVSVGLIPSLEVLHIPECSVAVLRSMVGVSSSIVRLTVENIEGPQLPQEVLEHLRAVEYLCIKCCDNMRYLWESESQASNFLVSLQKLEVSYCKMLVSFGEKTFNLDVSMNSLKEVIVRDCERLKYYDCPNSIERLVIWNCPSMASLSFHTVHEFPSTLKILDIMLCDNLEESWLVNNVLSPLESLDVVGVPNLWPFPEEGFLNLTRLIIRGCDNIESIPENGFMFLPLEYLEVIHCKNLKSFPYQHLPRLTSMKELLISHCPQMDYSFPCGSWPPELTTLTIGGLKKPMSMWGSQEFPAPLETLYLHGENSGGVPFANENENENSGVAPFANASSLYLPPSLRFLEINGFKDLNSVSKGLQHLTDLKRLVIDSCPKLNDLPDTLLDQLLSLKVYFCPKLQKSCHIRKGKYWHVLTRIPELYI